MSLLLRDLGEFPTFDTETTGIDTETDRIVTAFIGVMNREGQLVRKHEWLIDPGVPIPDGAAAVHGVTTEMAQANGRQPAECIAEILDVLRAETASGAPVLAYNGRYDLTILDREARRNGLAPLVDPVLFDPYVIDKALDRYRRGSRKLIDTCAHYDIVLENAHTADADAIAAGRLMLALVKRLEGKATTVEDVHQMQIGWARFQAESLEEYFRDKWVLNQANARRAVEALEVAAAEVERLVAEELIAGAEGKPSEHITAISERLVAARERFEVATARAEELAPALDAPEPYVEKIWPVTPLPAEALDDEWLDEFDLV